MVEDFRQLKVWSKAHALTLAVYAASQQFPRQELYGVTSQMRRSAASLGMNLAEGCGRRSDGEFGRFVQIARGSASELEYQLLLARDLCFLSPQEYSNLSRDLLEVQRMLTALAQTLRSSIDCTRSKARS
jgi:four helix bundle protein